MHVRHQNTRRVPERDSTTLNIEGPTEWRSENKFVASSFKNQIVAYIETRYVLHVSSLLASNEVGESSVLP